MDYSSDINYLRKCFLCCTPINTINLLFSEQNIDLVNVERQQEILKKTVKSKLITKYPIKQSYQRAFLKWLMNKTEEKDGIVDDSIFVAYCDLLHLSSDEPSHYRHFIGDDEQFDRITVFESTNIVSEGTTGLCSWQGAIDLANWCIENKNELSGKVILELGCGVGFAGLCTIKKCSPKQYIFTDCHEKIFEMLLENIKLNLLSDEKIMQLKSDSDRLKLEAKYDCTNIKVMELKWEDIDKYVNEEWVMPDIIMGSDILYDTDSFHALVLGLKMFLSRNNTYAIIAATIRNMDTFSQFLYQLEFHNLSFEECSFSTSTVYMQFTSLPFKILKIFQGSQ